MDDAASYELQTMMEKLHSEAYANLHETVVEQNVQQSTLPQQIENAIKETKKHDAMLLLFQPLSWRMRKRHCKRGGQTAIDEAKASAKQQ